MVATKDGVLLLCAVLQVCT